MERKKMKKKKILKMEENGKKKKSIENINERKKVGIHNFRLRMRAPESSGHFRSLQIRASSGYATSGHFRLRHFWSC